MSRYLYEGGLLLCLGALLCGCRKDLCYDHELHGLNVRVEVRPDWECVWERDYGMDWDDNWAEESFAARTKRSVPSRPPASPLSSITRTGRARNATCPRRAGCCR